MSKTPVTNAIRALMAAGVKYTGHLYKYEDKGGTEVAARSLGIDEHAVIKTLVMEDDMKRAMIVLMHGDREVSTKGLARAIDAKTVSPCSPQTVQRLTGYQVGGVSPFGALKGLPVYMEAALAGLALVYINGGKRGFLVAMSPSDIVALLRPVMVSVATA